MYGVVDELGVLEEDEVFINLPYHEGPIISDVLVIRYSLLSNLLGI